MRYEDLVGRPVESVPTPAMLVEADSLEHNLRLMAGFFADRPCKLRPHFKSHKCVTLAHRQLAVGNAAGVTCAKLAEAEALVAGGIQDVLIANQVVGADKARRLAALNHTAVVHCAVDSAQNLAELGEAARRADVTIGVLIEVDIGMKRCGVQPGTDALTLAMLAAKTKGLRLDGLQGYEGHLVMIADPSERRCKTLEAMNVLVEQRRLLETSGLPCAIVSGGGTGTYDITGTVEGIDEVQAGSYALMDCHYRKLRPEFRNAMSILTTVISSTGSKAVVDVGLKGMGNDFGLPVVIDQPDAKVLYIAGRARADRQLPRPRRRAGSVDPLARLHHQQPAPADVDRTRRTGRGDLAHRGQRLHRMIGSEGTGMAGQKRITRGQLEGKIIDVHTHVGITLCTYLMGSYPYGQSVESLLYKMNANSVDAAVTFPTWESVYFDTARFLADRVRVAAKPRIAEAPYVLENRLLCEEVYDKTPGAPGRVLPFACVDPGRCIKRQVKELQRLADEYPLYGIKISGVMIQSSHRHLLGKGAAFVHLAKDRNWPILLHSTAYAGDRFCHNSINLAVARHYPQVRFCLAHCLGFDKVCLDQADAMDNVWVDCAAMKIQVEPEEILAPPERRFPSNYRDYKRVFGDLAQAYPATMLWGTDSPAYTYVERRKYADGSQVNFTLQGSYEMEKAALDSLDRKSRTMVANRNTRRFLFG